MPETDELRDRITKGLFYVDSAARDAAGISDGGQIGRIVVDALEMNTLALLRIGDALVEANAREQLKTGIE